MLRGSLIVVLLATLCVPMASAEMVVVPLGVVSQAPNGPLVTRPVREVTGAWVTHAGAVAQDQEDLVLCAFPHTMPGAACPPPGLICGFSITTFRIRLTSLGASGDVLTLRAGEGPGLASATAEGLGGVAELDVTQGTDCPWVWVAGTRVPLARTAYTLRVDAVPGS